MKKVYINARFLSQPITGVQRFAIELSKSLIVLRNDVVFLVPNLNDIIDKSLLSVFNIQEVVGGGGHFWEQITLPKFLKSKGSPLLVNLCNTAPILYRNKLSMIHDINFLQFPQSYSWKFRNFYKILVPLIIRSSKKVLTGSSFSKNEISEYYRINKEDIPIIYSAVSDIFNQDKNSIINGKKYALAVSSPVFHKNFSRMIDAFLKSNAEIDLKIIGSLSNSFSAKENNLILDSRVKFIGRVSDQQLVNLYQNAEFFIFPSLYEGFGIPPLEAQACGCPVISSNAASMPEVLKDSALYFDPYSVDEMKSCIERMGIDEDLREKLIQNGFKNTKRFSWHNSAMQLHLVIEEISTSTR